MGRLIDADALEKEGWQLVRVNPKVPPVNEHKYLKDVPTAYDVDKVVKEINNEENWCNAEEMIHVEVVEEIVRRGGVNE